MTEKGFTLVEIMIVLAVIGILAAIAIPNYLELMTRARVTEGLTLAYPAEMAVFETTLAHQTLPASQSDTTYTSPTATENVASVKIADAGKIIITYTPRAGDGTIVFTPVLQESGGITWDCRSGSLAVKYRPVTCR